MFKDKTSLEDDSSEKLIANQPNNNYDQVFNDVNKSVNNMESVNIDQVTDLDINEDINENIDVNKNNQSVNDSQARLAEQKDKIQKIGRNLDIKDSDIHHMPDKFLKPNQEKKKNNTFLILIIVLVVVIILIVGLFAFFALQGGGDEEGILDLGNDDNIGNEINNFDNNSFDLNTSEGRDSQRLNDIIDIKSALSFYYKDIGKYPYRLSSLTKYILEIPNNPEPGGEDYYYEVGSDGESYILTFVLEGIASLGNLNLTSGKYQLTPDLGISAYREDNIKPETGDPGDPSIEIESEPNVEPNIGLLPIPELGSDNDGDGLTDVEEVLLGTKISLPDSDFDGYLDGEELTALYDPLNDGARLEKNSEAITIYNDENYNYSILYPAQWFVEKIEENGLEVGFYSDQEKSGDFFKVQISRNPQNLTIQKWYSYFSPGSNTSDLRYFENDSVVGLTTKDGFNVYIADRENVYIISYIIVNTKELNFSKVFEMFINSFKIIK